MMESTTLQAPKSGRSRFSKALPAPPPSLGDGGLHLPLFDFESRLPPTPAPAPQAVPSLPRVPRKQLQTKVSTPTLAPTPTSTTSSVPLPLPPPKAPGREREWDRESTTTTITTVTTWTGLTSPVSAKALDSPLPPLPPSLPLASPPPMSIPRRPVGAPTVAPISVTTQPQAPVSVPPASPDPSLSPVASLSSLLSAYSNHTSESTPRSSTNSANDIVGAKGTYSTDSPIQDGPSGNTRSDAPPAAHLLKLSSDQDAQRREVTEFPPLNPYDDDDDLPPPPPLKDANRTMSRPQTPISIQTTIQTTIPTGAAPTAPPPASNASSTPADTSPHQQQPPQELWRRRSLRGEKNIAVPGLKLAVSHGSTATSGATPSPLHSVASLPPTQPLPPLPPQNQSEPAAAQGPAPPTPNPGFPGRNIRPSPPSEQQPPAPIPKDMGHALSHSKIPKPNKVRSPEQSRQTGQAAYPTTVVTGPPQPSSSVSPLSGTRLPTPEYGTNDVKSLMVETVISPVSPASSPEPLVELKAPIARKAVGAPGSTESRLLKSSRSSPVLGPSGGLSLTTPTTRSGPAGLPASPAATRAQSPSQTRYMPYRPGDEKRQAPQLSPVATRREQTEAAEPLAPKENRASPVEIRREETGAPDLLVPKQRLGHLPASPRQLRPIVEVQSAEVLKTMPPVLEVKEIREISPPPQAQDAGVSEESDHTDNPGAAMFPRNWQKPPQHEVLDARPLTDRQYRCITGHRYMTSNRQRVNPIACRTCGQKDRNADAMICSACSLNICVDCNFNLRRFRGDLGRLVQFVEVKRAEAPAKAQLAVGEGETAANFGQQQQTSPPSVQVGGP